MGATGTATLDFGGFPGKLDVTVAVTGQTGITTASLVEAWIMPPSSSQSLTHSADEHVMATSLMSVVAGNIAAGTGFTIYGLALDTGGGIGEVTGQFKNLPRRVPRLWGTFNIAWAWL